MVAIQTNDTQVVHISQNGFFLTIDCPDVYRNRLEKTLSFIAEKRGIRNQFNAYPVDMYVSAGDKLICGFGLKYRIVDFLKTNSIPYVFNTDMRYSNDVYALNPNIPPDVTFREGQLEVITHCLQRDCGLFVAPTGWGKSWVIRLLCQIYHKARIDYLTYSSDLSEEVYQDLSKVLPDVGRIAGAKKKFGRVQVVNLMSAHHTGFDADIILADEVDQMAAPKFMEKLGGYGHNKPCKAFAFTASLKRSDNCHRVLESVFGPVVHEVTYSQAQSAKMVVPIKVEMHTPKIDIDLVANMDSGPARDRIGIWRNQLRNEFIAELCKRYNDDQQVLILVDKVDHAYRLKSLLPDFEVCYAPSDSNEDKREKYIDYGILDKSEPVMTTKRRKQLKQGFADCSIKKVIATKVWARGLNFHKLAVLIRADGGYDDRNSRQVSGRLSRTAANKSLATLVDIWDDWSPAFLARSRSRKRTYADLGFDVTVV